MADDDTTATDTSVESTAVADTPTEEVAPDTAAQVDSTLAWDAPQDTTPTADASTGGDAIDPSTQDQAGWTQFDASMDQNTAANQDWRGSLADQNADNAEWQAKNATDPEDRTW